MAPPESPQKSFEAEWRARFDRFAARGGSDANISGWSEHGMERRLHVVMRAMAERPPAPGALVLDLGCGSGVYCLHLREAGLRPIGADYSIGMLRRAQAVVSEVASVPGIPLTTADLLRLPFRSGVFDALVNVGVLQHVERAEMALAEMARVLTPDGRAFVITLNRFSLHALAASVLGTLRAWAKGTLRAKKHAVRRSASGLAAAAAAGGLALETVRGVYLYPKGLRWLERVLDALDGLRWPGGRKPALLPLANAYLIVVRKPPAPAA